jgi:hypothetical protein
MNTSAYLFATLFFAAVASLIFVLFQNRKLQSLVAVLQETLTTARRDANEATRAGSDLLQQHLASYNAEIQRMSSEYQAELARARSDAEKKIRAGEELVQQQLTYQKDQVQKIASQYQAQALRVQTECEDTIKVLRAKLDSLEELSRLAQSHDEVRLELTKAVADATELRERAREFLQRAKTTADAEVAAAAQRAKEIRFNADSLLSEATRNAGGIIERANEKALEIAGDAYTALRDKERLEQASIAIRNIIDGYGDRYIVPTRSLLDGLAEDFGHMEAGRALAAARDQTRRMIIAGEAATCDYVEAARKDTAIRFVIDAFNGRVDAILSRTKHDNFGTLQQEIIDAFSLVNLNGKAFKDARILPAYLDARLLELKWAVVAQELRFQEREEQRRLKEQIREEEKARREYEKAMADAQREEEILMKALAKAREDAEKATAEQKQKLEFEIANLSQKLSEAEARNQRALSMAQQTRKGNVYIISNVGSFGEDVMKIGMTRRLEPLDRVKELGDASVPFEFDVHAMIPSDDAPALENLLHSELDDHRVNHVNFRKEFFRVSLDHLRKFVVEKGINVSFTMLAEAREYRETMRLSKMSAQEREKYWTLEHSNRTQRGIRALPAVDLNSPENETGI